MERLQAAIEKARVMRGETQESQAAQGSRAAMRAPLAGQDPGHNQDRERSEQDAVDAAWAALKQVDLDKRRMARNRVRTLAQNSESAPFDLLRTRMLQMCKQNDWRRVAIVSPHAACGKSTTALNLAFSLERQKDLRSLIFDFDLRRSGLTKLVGHTPDHDITAVLEGAVRFADQGLRRSENVAFGLSGAGKTLNPSETLQSQQTTAVLDQVEATYQPNLMLFDMPPLLASDDNFGFLQNVDCALILVAAEETRMSQIDLAERQVAELTNVMGVVLNKCRHTAHSQHSYDYSSYY